MLRVYLLQCCVRLIGVLVTLSVLASAPLSANAGEWSTRIERPTVEPWRELWAGAETTGQTWSAYTGMTVALGGAIRDNGWRLRSVSGYGRYHYEGYKFVGGHPVALTTIQGTSQFTDLLIGYQVGFGPLTLKAFAGASMDGHRLTPDDPSNATRGIAYGAKAALELWLNLSQAAWLSLDQSYASAHNTYSARARGGYRVVPPLSIGPEVGASGTSETQNGRLGGFLRYEWAGGEASASSGVTGDIAKPTTPYATVNVMLRY